MKTTKWLLTVIFFLLLSSVMFGQKKYAVLIAAEPNPQIDDIVPPGQVWPGGTAHNDDFWNDVFMIRQMLIYKFDFLSDDVHTIFANDIDFPDVVSGEGVYPTRYTNLLAGQITDLPCTVGDINYIFTSLASEVGPDDFLFVYVFSHGFRGFNPYPDTHSYFWCNDGKIWDSQFYSLVNNIQANKKVIWMQPCNSGGFADEFANDTKVIFNSACLDSESAHRADNLCYSTGTDVFTENENYLWENGETWPQDCHHGEFSYHMFSACNGALPHSPSETTYNNEPLSNADLNGDGFITMKEAYLWEESKESMHVNSPNNLGPEHPVFQDPGNIGASTSFKYPTLLSSQTILDPSYRGLIGITDNITIPIGTSLTFKANSKIYFLNNAYSYINIPISSTLILEDGVQIFGDDGAIIVNGTITLGQGVTFTKCILALGFYLANHNVSNAIFNDSWISSSYCNLTMENTTLNHSQTNLLGGNLTLQSCNFNYTNLNSSALNNNQQTIIQACIFDHAYIDLQDYKNFIINNNQIFSSTSDGLKLTYCGNGSTGNQLVNHNTIYNCATTGITIFNSNATISRNNIHNNNSSGIKILNNSNVSVFGITINTQNIQNNVPYQVYSSEYCFPTYFKYNRINDLTTPTIFIDRCTPDPIQIDLRKNCWDDNFSVNDLYGPNVEWIINPKWCPEDGDPFPVEPSIDLYQTAVNEYDSGNFVSAKNLFKLVINEFPESRQALSSVEVLFTLEERAENNYYDLKQYYLTNDSIIAHITLKDLAEYYANRCNEKIDEWGEEIAWFENKILFPVSSEDSIFSIIDLEHTYFLLENSGLKSSISCSLPQYRPKSKIQFVAYKDSLISLLPFNKHRSSNSQINLAKEGEILQIVPNPFSSTTTIYYSVITKSDVELKIFNSHGEVILVLQSKDTPQGINNFSLTAFNLSQGFYYCSLCINGTKIDSKKMMLVK